LEQKSNYKKSRRLRIFAGPNGSGKTTVLKDIRKRFDLGIYINADDVEVTLKDQGFIDLTFFGVDKIDSQRINQILSEHTITQKALLEGYEIHLQLEGNLILAKNTKTYSYEAALISDLIRNELLELGKKFAFETVMSHSSKIEFMELSKSHGFKNYLYYISTESPLINIGRVQQRVKLGGHDVDNSKIKSRYYKSLSQLKPAILQSYRSFIFDNSGLSPTLILEIYKGEDVTIKHSRIPVWVDQFVLNRE
jgi:predicted ABC-type ATPase